MHNTNCNEQVKKKDNKKWWRYSAQDRNLLAVKWPAKLINAPSELRRYTVIAQECNVNLKQLKNSNSEKKQSWSETTLWWKIKNRSIFDILSVLTHARNVLSRRLRKAPLSPCVQCVHLTLKILVTSQVPHPLARLGSAIYLWQTTVGNWAIYCVPRMAFKTLVISKGSSVNILESSLHYAAVYTRMW